MTKFRYDDYTKRKAVLDARYRDIADLSERFQKYLEKAGDSKVSVVLVKGQFGIMLFDLIGKLRVALEEVVEVADYLIVEEPEDMSGV